MSRFLTTRLSLWLPGVAALAAAIGIAALLGLAAGVRAWPWYLGLVLAALLAIGWHERFRARRQAAPPRPRSRGKLKIVRGGKAGYDLAQDDSTDHQKYMM